MNEIDHEIRACLDRMATEFQILEKEKQNIQGWKKLKGFKRPAINLINIFSTHFLHKFLVKAKM